MNKKLTVTFLCIAVGVVMLVTTAFASMSGNTGYDTYKTALENMAGVKSLTGNIQMSVTDNGKEMLKIDSKIKADNSAEEKVSSSTVIKTETQAKGFDLFVENGNAVLKANDSDVYNVMKGDFKSNQDSSMKDVKNPESMKAGEMVIDAFVGDLKNYFTTTDMANGEKQVIVQLSDNQIPTLVNALASLAVKNSDTKEMNINKNILPFGLDLNVKLPKLTEDIRIDNISLIADISKESQIKNQVIDFTLSGKDAEAVKHTLKLSINLSLSDLNTTLADTVDLTGKNINTIDKAEFKSMGSGN